MLLVADVLKKVLTYAHAADPGYPEPRFEDEFPDADPALVQGINIVDNAPPIERVLDDYYPVFNEAGVFIGIAPKPA
ncbi:MAG TPA: hypothetical protein GXX28_05580 [Firmicutes bacterium]|nr:hypothetical protein [Bacillota bacterium]